jgi:O-antigen ligase
MEAQRELVEQPLYRASGLGILDRTFEWLLLVWTGSIPLMIWSNIRFQRYRIPLTDFIFPAAFLAFLAALAWGGRRWRRSSWYGPLLAYACALILSTLFSQNFRQSLPKAAGDIYLIAAAILTVQYIDCLESLRRILLAWVTGLIVTGVTAWAGVTLFFFGRTQLKENPFLFRFGSLPSGQYPRLRATFLNANMMCSYMTCGILLLFAARHAGWISRRTFRILLPIALGATAFSFSPGLDGLCVAMGLWLASRDSFAIRRRIVGGVGLLIAVIGFAVTLISPTPLMRGSVIQTILHPEPSARVQTWLGAWDTFRAHPVFGRGLESDATHLEYALASGGEATLTDAHNTWLSIMAQQGIVGVLAFGWVVFHLARRFRFVAHDSGEREVLKFAIELAMLGGFLCASLTGSFQNTRHVWAVMGLVAAIQALPESEGELIRAC